MFGDDPRGRAEWGRVHDGLGSAGDGSLVLLLARADGSPAATGAVFFEPDLAGLHCFTTRERMRGRGWHPRSSTRLTRPLGRGDRARPSAGHTVSDKCGLTAIPGSHLATVPGDLPAQISFNNRGTVLAVAERGFPLSAPGNIEIFPVDGNGVAVAATVNTSPQQDPYGLAWTKRDVLTVTNAFYRSGGAGSTASSSIDMTPIGQVTMPRNSTSGLAAW